MATLESLVEMGFEEQISKRALDATGNGTMEQVINWILENQSSPSTSSNSAAEQSNETPASQENENTLAYKCDDCGKVFFDSQKVEFHAVRSGHQNFSESKQEGNPVPLTEEEKKQKLKDLQERIKARRTAKAQQEEREAFEREKERVSAGKNMAEVKKRLEEAEMKKAIEERKREKEKTKNAKDQVLRLIEEDKERRRQAKAADSAPKQTAAPVPAEPVQKEPAKEYTECRIQFRLPKGNPVVHKFTPQDRFSVVFDWLRQQHPPPTPLTATKISTAYPKRFFSDQQMDMSLSSLGLAPASVLVVSYH